MLLGCLPPVLFAIQEDFHPEDLMAMGLAFGGLACARRGHWVWAGILLGFALTSQQFAFLVAAPLLVVVPRSRRVKYAAAVVGSSGVVVVGMLVTTSGRVMNVLTGATATPSSGSTFLAGSHLHDVPLLLASRVLPIGLSVVVAWWSARRLGPGALDPIPLVSLIATSLCLRLVFEVNLFGYYFMAVAVSLLVLGVISRRHLLYLAAWLALVMFVYDPLTWGRGWTYPVPTVFFQFLLVPPALALAVAPLVSLVRDQNRSVLDASADDQSALTPESVLQSVGI